MRVGGLALGVGAWVTVGGAMGGTPLGLFAPVSLALRGVVSAWVALAVVSGAALGFGTAWILLAARRPEHGARTGSLRHLAIVWRFPVPAALSSLLLRRPDVRRATVAALGFGATGALVAVVGGAEPPGPFLLATTTTLLGSLVAALAAFGTLATGSWIWVGAPREARAIAGTTWLVGLAATAAPVVVVAGAVAVVTRVDSRTVGVVAVLAVVGTALATITGSLVPWQGAGLGDQLSSLAALVAVAVAASVTIGFVAPRLATLGVPDSGTAVVLCGLLSIVAVAILAGHLEAGAR